MTFRSRSTPLALFFGVALPFAHALPAQSPSDSAAIRAAALDYIDGWYGADGARMERAVHPELAKRNVTSTASSGRSRLIQMGAMTLVQSTRDGGGSRMGDHERAVGERARIMKQGGR